MSKYKLKLTAEFFEMFYTTPLPYKDFSTSYINLVHAKVYHFLGIAISFPDSFSSFSSPKETLPIRKIIIDKRFLILYEMVGDVIEVLYFVDGRRSYENMLTY